MSDITPRTVAAQDQAVTPNEPPPRNAAQIEQQLFDDVARQYRPTLPVASLISNITLPWQFYSDLDAMVNYHAVNLPLAYVMSVLSHVKVAFQCRNDEEKKFCTEQFDHFWSNLRYKLTEGGYPYGWSAAEAVYELQKGKLSLKDLSEFNPRDVQPLTIKGQYCGFRVSNAQSSATGKVVDLWGPDWGIPSKGIWYRHRPRYGSIYGTSQIKPAWRPWRRLAGRDGLEDLSDLADYRQAIGIIEIGYPDEDVRANNSVPSTASGNRVNMRQVAQEMGENIRAGSNVALPTSTYTNGQRKWTFDYKTASSNVEQFLKKADHLEQACCKGVGVPPEILEASESGSGWSGRMIPMQGFLMTQQVAASGLVNAWFEQILIPLLKWNFGKRAWARVTVLPLVKTFALDQAPKQPAQQQPPPQIPQPQQEAQASPQEQPQPDAEGGDEGGEGFASLKDFVQNLATTQGYYWLASTNPADWQQYTSKKSGATGWRNTVTKEVRYQKNRPGTGRSQKGSPSKSAPQQKQVPQPKQQTLPFDEDWTKDDDSPKATDLSKTFRVGDNGVSKSLTRHTFEHLNSTGEVLPADKHSLIGQSWKAVRDRFGVSPDIIKRFARTMQQAILGGHTSMSWRKALGDNYTDLQNASPQPKQATPPKPVPPKTVEPEPEKPMDSPAPQGLHVTGKTAKKVRTLLKSYAENPDYKATIRTVKTPSGLHTVVAVQDRKTGKFIPEMSRRIKTFDEPKGANAQELRSYQHIGQGQHRYHFATPDYSTLSTGPFSTIPLFEECEMVLVRRKRKKPLVALSAPVEIGVMTFLASSMWKPYQGRHGGQGWQNVSTGEVRYQEKAPDDRESAQGGSESNLVRNQYKTVKPVDDEATAKIKKLKDAYTQSTVKEGKDPQRLHQIAGDYIEKILHQRESGGANDQISPADVVASAYRLADMDLHKEFIKKGKEEAASRKAKADTEEAIRNLSEDPNERQAELVDAIQNNHIDWKHAPDHIKIESASAMQKLPLNRVFDMLEQSDHSNEGQQAILTAGLHNRPSPGYVPLQGNTKQFVVIDDSLNSSPAEKRRNEAILRLFPQVKTLAGSHLKVAMLPKAWKPEKMESLLGARTVERLGGQGEKTLFDESKAPLQVAAAHVPASAKSDLSDKVGHDIYDLEKVPRYKRLNADHYIRFDPESGAHTIVSKNEVPQLIGIHEEHLQNNPDRVPDQKLKPEEIQKRRAEERKRLAEREEGNKARKTQAVQTQVKQAADAFSRRFLNAADEIPDEVANRPEWRQLQSLQSAFDESDSVEDKQKSLGDIRQAAIRLSAQLGSGGMREARAAILRIAQAAGRASQSLHRVQPVQTLSTGLEGVLGVPTLTGTIQHTHRLMKRRKSPPKELCGTHRLMARNRMTTLGWSAFTTRTGKLKAVGTGEHQGKTLYGERAQKALAGKPQKLSAQDVHGHIEHLNANRSEMTAEKIADLIGNLKNLTREQLKELKQKIGIRAGGNKSQMAEKIAKLATQEVAFREHWTREARKNGIKPAHLRQAANMFRNEHADVRQSIHDAIRAAKSAFEHYNGKPLTRRIPAFRDGDWDSIPHWDEIAQSVYEQVPEAFVGSRNDLEERLHDIVLSGVPKTPTWQECYTDALGHLKTTAKHEELDEIPF